MGSWNRIWILFVIVAIGLVLSWQQVGQRTAAVIDAELEVLRTEVPCNPLRAPCAALGGRYGLVLGPVGDYPDRLVLQPAGFALESATLDAALHDRKGDRTVELAGHPSPQQGFWVLSIAARDTGRDRYLRASVSVEDKRLVAEFPFR